MPVKYPEKNDVPYVICVKALSPNVFKESNAKRYEHMLEKFAKRIAMEPSLLLITKHNPTPNASHTRSKKRKE